MNSILAVVMQGFHGISLVGSGHRWLTAKAALCQANDNPGECETTKEADESIGSGKIMMRRHPAQLPEGSVLRPGRFCLLFVAILTLRASCVWGNTFI